MGEAARVIPMPAPTKKLSFADALKKTATAEKPKGKAKASMPELDAPPEVRDAVDKYIAAKEDFKKAEAELDAYGNVITEFTRTHQDEDGYAGRFRNSYAVPGTKPENKVKFVSSNRFSISSADAEQIAGLLGEKFDEMIDTKHSVKLKAEVLERQELQDELMELIGDRFAEFFETEAKLSVKEKFDERLYQVVKEKEDLAALRMFCRPYKPSLR